MTSWSLIGCWQIGLLPDAHATVDQQHLPMDVDGRIAAEVFATAPVPMPTSRIVSKLFLGSIFRNESIKS
ncbi:MAG: hypothetical protein VB862_07140, partial [Pirellulaceae bacterium]